MRSVAALQTCFALLLAFLIAPFEHVHPGSSSDPDHSAVIHAHLFSIHGSRAEHHGKELCDSDDDDHDAVWSVDTFTLVVTHIFSPFVPARVPVLLFARSEIFAPIEVVEERGHDPPVVDRSIPRAPPS